MLSLGSSSIGLDDDVNDDDNDEVAAAAAVDTSDDVVSCDGWDWYCV